MKYPFDRLPLLKEMVYGYPNGLFDGVCVIACQHILPSTHLMFRSLFDLGLSPQYTHIIGKCYSTSKAVAEKMRKDGIHVSPWSESFDSHRAYDEQFKDYLDEFVLTVKNKLLLERKPKAIVVFDDGGELLHLTNKYLAPKYHIVGVEQTTAGYNKLKDNALLFPVANIARSWAKIEHESPMISRSQTIRILAYLQTIKGQPEKCLIIGHGAIGKNLHEALKYYFHVDCFDSIPEKSMVKNINGNLKDYDIVIGATGKRVFDDFSAFKEGALLINAASSDREFPAELLRSKIAKVEDCHKDIVVGGILLPNCGFPINFRGGDFDTVPLDRIQLTVALLTLGACNLLTEHQGSRGLIDLRLSDQRRLIRCLNKAAPTRPSYKAVRAFTLSFPRILAST
jgi:S-adenosylhomocysteine hydrolase